jgi:signal transduction histidine kinase
MLRDEWDENALQDALRFIAPLVQPFSLSDHGSLKPHATDFSIFVRYGLGEKITVSDTIQRLFKHAVAEITASVDAKGEATIAVSSSRFKSSAKGKPITQVLGAYASLSGVKLRAFYYIRSKEYLPFGEDRTLLRDTLTNQGGIKLYRNGFRVQPYGEKGDDWLSLDAEYARRSVLLWALGNQNFLGFIEVHDPAGAKFQETSNREGLIETAAVRQLRSFGSLAIIEAVRLINNNLIRASDTDAIPKGQHIRNALRRAELKAEQLKRARSPRVRRQLIDDIQADIKMARKSFTTFDTRLIKEIGMLRALATLGISVAEFVHETRNTVTLLSAGLLRVLKRTKDATIQDATKDINSKVRLLGAYTDYFSHSLTDMESRELHPIEMHDAIGTFKRIAVPVLSPRRIELATVVERGRLFSTEMHEAEWASVFLNLLSNSIKAIKRTSNRGEIKVTAARKGRSIVVDFLDNGDGIPISDWERVFEPFYSTTRLPEPRTAGSEEVTGMGLGLKIVRDTIGARKGTIKVVEPPEGYSTCFRITIPSGSEFGVTDG